MPLDDSNGSHEPLIIRPGDDVKPRLNAYDRGRKLTPQLVDRMIREQNMKLASALDERLQNFMVEVKEAIAAASLGAPAQPPTETPQPTDPD